MKQKMDLIDHSLFGLIARKFLTIAQSNSALLLKYYILSANYI